MLPSSAILEPCVCDGYGGDFSLTQALDCHKGGLITQHHNDALGDLATLGYQKVVCEPIVCDKIGDFPP